LFYKPEPNIRI